MIYPGASPRDIETLVVDPLEEDYYTYSSNVNLTSYQVMAFLEEGGVVSYNIGNQVHAGVEDRYPKSKGAELGDSSGCNNQ